jgi:peptidoglycan/LPS O-acetylase OafA/YrhL
MFQNYLGIKSIDVVYWTLFVEMKFYIFIVGTYLIFNKIKEVKIEHLIFFWLSLSLLYIPLNELIIFKVLNYFLILQWSSYFIAGMIFYQIYKNGPSIKYCVLLGISFGICLYHGFARIEHLETNYNTSFSPLIIGITIFIFYLVMFLATTNKMKNINSPKLMQLGMLTYPLYLIHQNIGFIILDNFGAYINKYLLVFIIILLMVAISYILSKFYEPIVSGFITKQLEKLTSKNKKN